MAWDYGSTGQDNIPLTYLPSVSVFSIHHFIFLSVGGIFAFAVLATSFILEFYCGPQNPKNGGWFAREPSMWYGMVV
jgi:hypothetical protein